MITYTRVLKYCTDRLAACHWLVAALMLMAMFAMGITSMAHDSAIVDELAHIPAGYSYLHYGDYRLNPEHPPLIKDLAAVPLQFMHLTFPTDEPGWTSEVNGQWDVGYSFLFYEGNDANRILFWSRLPLLLLAIGFGVFLYIWLLRRSGRAVALLALFFYAFSPNILAHARYVTTDVGASIFIFGALLAYARWARQPSRRNFIWLSVGLAVAALVKDSSILLYPFLFGMSLIWVLINRLEGGLWPLLRRYAGGFILAALLSVVWIYLAYLPETWHMATAVQRHLISGVIPRQPSTTSFLYWAAGVPGLKPLVQYALGIAMVYSRLDGGNVAMFFGKVSDQAFFWYFPVIFVLKTQIAFLLFMLSTAGFGVWLLMRRGLSRLRIRSWLSSYWLEVTLGLFCVTYFIAAMKGNLDLGIRHILPVYLPLFVLVAEGLVWVWRAHLRSRRFSFFAGALGAGLLAWYGMSTVWIYPNFLAYFNEIIGGPSNAYRYFSDSSVDWGQDLYRFQDYVAAHPEIKSVGLDYFGGADVRYYLCQIKLPTPSTGDASFDCSHNKIQIWHAENGRYTGQYVAVSETFLENDRFYAPIYGYEGYDYLRQRQPVAKIGYSIYLYKLY